MRAVLDTNVIVSGLLSPKGKARLVLAMAFARLTELRRVGELVKPTGQVSESPDEPDNRSSSVRKPDRQTIW